MIYVIHVELQRGCWGLVWLTKGWLNIINILMSVVFGRARYVGSGCACHYDGLAGNVCNK
jgi:hypothetical protein